MPSISGGALTRWRSYPQAMLIKAAFIKPVIIFERRLNMASVTYPVAALTYDNPDGKPGVYTDVQPDMTIGVYSSASVFKGFCRVRKAATATLLYINETSPGDITFADNDKLIVYDDYRLWSKVPRMTASQVFYKDYDLAYSDQGDKLRPVANAGPGYANDVDAVTGTVDVDFNWANSFRLAAGIGDTLTYAVNFKDGTIITGSSTSATATVRFPAGQRWVDLTVTDAARGHARDHQRRRRLAVCACPVGESEWLGGKRVGVPRACAGRRRE